MNKEHYYLKAIEELEGDLYKILFEDQIDYKDIRNKAITIRFDELRKSMEFATLDDIYIDLEVFFDCSYGTIKRVIINRRSLKF